MINKLLAGIMASLFSSEDKENYLNIDRRIIENKKKINELAREQRILKFCKKVQYGK